MISVVTITYRDPEGLKKTIASLDPMMKKGVEWEHVVIDSSPEINSSILSELPSNWPLKHSVEPARGIYAAMNSGIERSQGDWIWLLNGGDRLHSIDVLNECLAIAKRSPEIDLICAGSALFRNGEYQYDRLPRADFLSSILGSNRLSHQGILYRKKALAKVGKFSEKFRIASDYEHHFRCYIAKLNSRMIYKPLVVCELGGASDDFVASMKECEEITTQLKGRLPSEVYRKHQRALLIEKVRLSFVKALAASNFKNILRPYWVRWNRIRLNKVKE